MIVMKFGGSSLESPEAIRRVRGIVANREAQRPALVVSAHGSVTNRLLHAAQLARAGKRAEMEAAVEETRAYHHGLAEGVLGGERLESAAAIIDSHISELLEVLRGVSVLGELTTRTADTAASYGERISSRLMALALEEAGVPARAVDSRTVLVTDERHTQAQPHLQATYERLGKVKELVQEGIVPVLGGFIGATDEGVTTTLGRGGSDYSASIFGAGLDADEIQIWTDVDGVLTTDPRTFDRVHLIRTLSYAEAAELAYFGAKVLHPATLLPAIQKSIPVRVLNSRKPEENGTLIVKEVETCRNPVKAIACKRGITVMNIHSSRMLMAYGFLRRIFEVFDRHETPVDVVCTSEVSVSLTIDNTHRFPQVLEELERFSMVSSEGAQAIVAIVGDNLRYTPGIAARALGALKDVNVRMVSQGASLLNVTVVVREADVDHTIRALHEEFFRDLDPEVFQ